MNLQIALCLPRDGETVSLVRAVAMDALVRFGAGADSVDEILLALSEACGNVIRHAAPSDQYEVRLAIEGDECAISVIDAGGGIDLGAIGDAMPDASATGGRGVALMRTLADQIHFTSEPQAGTVVHLVKKLTLAPGGALARMRAAP